MPSMVASAPWYVSRRGITRTEIGPFLVRIQANRTTVDEALPSKASAWSGSVARINWAPRATDRVLGIRRGLLASIQSNREQFTITTLKGPHPAVSNVSYTLEAQLTLEQAIQKAIDILSAQENTQ